MSGQEAGQIPAFRPGCLKEAAAEHFLTLPALARELGVAEKTVYRWNRGESDPSGGSLHRVAQLLGRDPAWFYETEDMAA